MVLSILMIFPSCGSIFQGNLTRICWPLPILPKAHVPWGEWERIKAEMCFFHNNRGYLRYLHPNCSVCAKNRELSPVLGLTFYLQTVLFQRRVFRPPKETHRTVPTTMGLVDAFGSQPSDLPSHCSSC